MAGVARAKIHRYTAEKSKQLFLDALQKSPHIGAACAAGNICRKTAYNWKAKDKEFAAKWEEHLENAVDDLEQEAIRRAYRGTGEPVYYKGQECGTIQRYSDLLLIFLLKAHRPNKYREVASIQGPEVNGPVVIRMITDNQPPKE